MNQEVCNNNDVKSTLEILKYFNNNLAHNPPQYIQEYINTLSCILPSDLTSNDFTTKIPEEDYASLREILGDMYDTFSIETETDSSKDKFVEEMFNIAKSMPNGKEPPEIKVEELLGGARTPTPPEAQTPTPPEAKSDTKVNNEEQERKVNNEDKPNNAVFGTITVQQVLSSGMLLCLVHRNEHLPTYMVMTPFTFNIVSGATTIIINQTINILFSEKVKSILGKGVTFVDEHMGFSKVRKFVTSKLNNFSSSLAKGTRWLIIIILLRYGLIYLVNSLYRNLTSLLHNSNVYNIDAILNLDTIYNLYWILQYMAYTLMSDKRNMFYILPSIHKTLIPIYGNTCAITTEDLIRGDVIDDNIKLIAESIPGSECIMNRSIEYKSRLKGNMISSFGAIHHLSCFLDMLIFLYPEDDRLKSFAISLNNQVKKVADAPGKVLSFVGENVTSSRGGKSRRRRKSKMGKKKTRKNYKKNTRKNRKKSKRYTKKH
jgi:hypothetical protein